MKNIMVNSISFKHGRFTITAERWSQGSVEIDVLNNVTGELRRWQDLGSRILQAEILVNVNEKLGLSNDDTDLIIKSWSDNV